MAGRIQVRDLAENKLQPQGQTPDLFVQPQRSVDDRSAEQLAESLGFFNQNLAHLASTMKVTRAKADQEKAQRQENQIALSSEDEKRQIAESGMVGGETLVNARVKKMAGAADAASWSSQMREHLATQNLSSMDVESYIRKSAGDWLKTVNNDPFVTGGFAGEVSDTIAWAKNAQMQQGLQEKEDVQKGTSFAYMKSQVDKWVGAGASPEQIQANLQALHNDVAAGSNRVIDEKFFDASRMSIAQQLVETNPEMAVALAAQGIKGADGKDRGSLADMPEYSGQVANLVQRGKIVRANLDTANAFLLTRKDNFNRILGVGDRPHDYSAFQDVTGPNGKTLTANEQRVQFLGDLDARMDEEIRAGRATEQMKREEVRRYTSRLGIDDPFVKGELDGIERRYNTTDAATQPEQLHDIEGRVAAWKEYRENSKNALNAQLSDKSRQFYEAFDTYKRYVSDSSQGAMEFANQVVNPPEGWDKNLSRDQLDKIDQSVKSHLGGYVFGIGGSSSGFSNAYAGPIRNLTQKYVAIGMDPDHAVDAATEAVFTNTLHFGGDPLTGLEKQKLPEDYQALMTKMVDDYKVMDARGKAYTGTPTFAHLGGGVIAMRDRDNGQFLEDQHGSMIVFNVQHLRDLSAQAQQKRDQNAVDAAKLAHQDFRKAEAQHQQDLKDAREGKYITRKVGEATDAVTGAFGGAAASVKDHVARPFSKQSLEKSKRDGERFTSRIHDGVAGAGHQAYNFLDFLGGFLKGD